MDITCRRCSMLIPIDDVSLDIMAARCRSCGALFSITEQVQPAGSWASRAPLDVPMPERFKIARPVGALRVSWRWFTPTAIFLAGFAIFWNTFICFWVTMALASGAGGFALFATLHVLVGLGLAYGTLSMFLNTTTVEVSHSALTVRHGPLPAPGNLALPREELRQLYCVERIHRSRRGGSVSYTLQAVRSDGRSVALVQGLESTEQALFLEQEIERFLGIADEPVRGALPK